MVATKNKSPLYVSNLADLAKKLLTNGPVKTAASSRRVRILHNGIYIADTTKAVHVWEHPWFPQWYLPWSAFASAQKSGKLSIKPGESVDDGAGNSGAKLYTFGVGSEHSDRVIGFDDSLAAPHAAAPLAGLVRVEFGAMQHWYEEDTEIFVHPKDPFKRIDVVSSSRPIEVRVGGVSVAKAAVSYHLYETGLPRRYYLPPTAVDAAVLRPSETVSKCPYKGEAEYYDVVLPDGQEFKDVVWYYRMPILESAAITGLYCFYNEKVEIWLDGEKEEAPKTHFA